LNQLNINNFPTLPSLAFGIYRSKYLKDFNIPIISGQILSDIKEGYTGGSTSLYIPYGKILFHYDVNSLYPSVMLNNQMPIGNIKFFEGDITQIDPNVFGFFKCEIIAPDNLNIPILQTKVKTSGGSRTISPSSTSSVTTYRLLFSLTSINL
jgi:hypothetical protein